MVIFTELFLLLQRTCRQINQNEMKTLIVEDNKSSGKLLQAVLESEGFETELADDGQDALDVLENHKVDCIISDIVMPNVDGYRLIYKVRRNEKLKDIPFIMYTSSYGSKDDEQFAVSLGVNKYMHKPGTARDIVKAVRELIESRNHPARTDDKISPRDQWVKEKYGKLLIDKLEQKIDELEKNKRELEWNEKKLVEAYEAIDKKKKMLSQEREQIILLNSALTDFQNEISHCSIVSRADKNGLITFVNKNFTDISGYCQEELLGQNHRILNSGFHPKSFWVNMWKTVSTGQRWRSEIKNKAKDGTFYWVDAFIIPFTDGNGNVTELLSIRNDITMRKLAEEKLAEAVSELTEYKKNLEKKVEMLREGERLAHFGNWEADLASGVNRWSDETFRLHGYDPGEVEPGFELFIRHVHPDDVEDFKRDLAHAMLCLDGYERKYRVLDKNKQIKYVDSKLVIHRDSNKKPIRLNGFLLDISEQTKYIQKIESQNNRLRDIAWMQCHGVRAPLARIMGLINVINMSNGSEENNQLFNYILESANELDSLIRAVVKKSEELKDS